MQKDSKFGSFFLWQTRWKWLLAALVVVGIGAVFFTQRNKPAAKAATFAARRGPLEITVLEGGSLQAQESQEIKCEVRVGYQGTKILKIVEEGYFVTPEDLKSNKVLVELDSSELQKQLVQQEIQYQSAEAALINAQQNYEIQLNQNQADVKDAEQKARFARMDFDKFVGDTVAAQIIEQVGLDKLLASATTNNVEQTGRAEQFAPEAKPAAPAAAGTSPPVVAETTTNTSNAPRAVLSIPASGSNASPLLSALNAVRSVAKDADCPDPEETLATNRINVDFSPYADIDKLGDGEAKQKLRKFIDDSQIAQKDLENAKTTVEGTRRLFKKGFVTQTELQRDEITYENKRLAVQTAESARDLFLRYDFVKTAEDFLSKYAQAVRELDKARRVAISKLAQAKANLKSARAQHQVQLRNRDDLNEQIEKCTLAAKKSGLVVYGAAGDDNMYWGDQERIREGATVRERQTIVTIPDMSKMIVKVKIHESYIKKVKKGQKARITADAYPDKVLTGEVTKVGVLPDTQWRWMNPDMKLYLTTITIDGTQDWMKPGMSAKVEIMVNKLDDCLYVPVQAVAADGDKQICYLARGGQPERREVQIGEFNDVFIQIKDGLKEGDLVLLRAPEGTEPQNQKPENGKKEDGKQPAPATAPVPGAVQAKT